MWLWIRRKTMITGETGIIFSSSVSMIRPIKRMSWIISKVILMQKKFLAMSLNGEVRRVSTFAWPLCLMSISWITWISIRCRKRVARRCLYFSPSLLSSLLSLVSILPISARHWLLCVSRVSIRRRCWVVPIVCCVEACWWRRLVSVRLLICFPFFSYM